MRATFWWVLIHFLLSLDCIFLLLCLCGPFFIINFTLFGYWIVLLLRQDLLCSLVSFWIMRICILPFGNRHYPSVQALITFPCNAFRSFSQWLQKVSLHAYANQSSGGCLRGTICTSPKFSFHAALSWLVFCPVNSNFLVFPRLPAPSAQLRDTSKLCGYSVLQSSLETLKAVNWGNCKAHLIYFFSLRGHCLSFPNVQCLDCHCLIYIICWCYKWDRKFRLWQKAKAEKYSL